MPKPRSRARPCLGYGTSGELPDVETTGAVVFVIGIRQGSDPGKAAAPRRPE